MRQMSEAVDMFMVGHLTFSGNLDHPRVFLEL
jgi:uncharacterized Zn-finger protein